MMPIKNLPGRTSRSRNTWQRCIVAGAVIIAMGCFGSIAGAKQADPGAAASDNGKALGAVNANVGAAASKAQGPKDKGPKKQGPFARLSGSVTNSLTGEGIAGATVTFAATAVTYSTVTDAGGAYFEKLPIATYDVTFAAPDYQSQTSPVSLVKGAPTTLDAALVPDAPVIVNASIAGDASPDAMLSASGSWKIMDGSTFLGVAWTQSEGAAATIDQPATASTDVTLPPVGDFKAELFHLLKEPPVGADELPPNVEVPPGEFVGGLQDRFQVVGINHFALERAGHVALHFAVTTTSGTYGVDVDVHTALDWRVNPGLRNVPVDIPVLLYGKDQANWLWMLADAPAGSLATLSDAMTQTPEFTPDVPGVYTVTEDISGEVLTIHAGTWRGVIVGQDADGLPVSDPACTGCHNGGFAPDTFSSWKKTGHAERFTTQLNGSFYSPSCFGCHTVGFDLAASNAGFDDVGDYAGFLASGLLGANDPVACPAGDWACMLLDYPQNAQRANIQCENCHGPQDGPLGSFSTAHAGGVFLADEPRLSLSSDVCATCHGEPLRHARFQQWQLSRHSNYEVAIDESGSGNCSRCHTANGFLTWLPALLDDVPGNELDNVAVSWTADEAHPQTCATCHDPHAIGTTSGNDSNARVRVSGDTPLLVAGFQAFGVGKGAMCMTCHNTRRGLRNDATWPATTDRDRAPHGGVQADLIMGQNAYFVEVGRRGAHSFVTDTCVTCHMKATPPPDVLAYNQGGSNHTFFASKAVCIECHTGGEPNSAGVQAAIGGPLHRLEGLIVDYYRSLIDSLLTAGNILDLDGRATITDPSQILAISLSETRGRQALVFELGTGDVGPVRLTTIDITGGPRAGTTLFDHVGETVLQATWNYLLVHTDRSGGVHNPAYSSLVLERAIAQF